MFEGQKDYEVVTPRMRRVSWNEAHAHIVKALLVTPRMRRVSWNSTVVKRFVITAVTPRMRRVSWNESEISRKEENITSRLAWGVWVEIYQLFKNRNTSCVTPRMRRVSWNFMILPLNTSRIRHASHEACELKYRTPFPVSRQTCHASHEACELKFLSGFLTPTFHNVTPRMRRVSWNFWSSDFFCRFWKSRLAWGVWVEIAFFEILFNSEKSHASHEACELKLADICTTDKIRSHASHEACELKSRQACLSVWRNACHASHEACELKWR